MRNVSFFLMVFFLVCACNAKREPYPVPLALALRSYASPQEVGRTIGSQAHMLEVLEDTKKNESDRRNAYHRVVVMARNIVDLNVVGSARLTFFNERLTSVWFYPQDPAKYRKNLQERLQAKLNISGDTTLPSGTVVRIATDHENRFYVSFEDPVLEEEHSEWIRENA